MLPTWAGVAVDVAFYAYLLWLCVVFFRIAQGKERVLVAGWCPGILLGPIEHLVSISTAAAIQYVQAVSIAVAFVAAVLILLEGPARGNLLLTEAFLDTCCNIPTTPVTFKVACL